ncbi:MAG: M28 family peptidase [Gemmatimonadaceae bacterium]|nr:M28 family peptidase [Gemmatimonadaceae bacterium]
MRSSRTRLATAATLTLLLASGALAQVPRTGRQAPSRRATAVRAPLPRTYVGPATVPAIVPGDLMTRLYRFADDSMMGREAGTAWNDKGTDFIAAELQKLGLEPAGENGTWFQSALMTRAIAGTSWLRVGTTMYELWKDWAPRDQGTVARPLAGALAIYGGTFGDTASYLAPHLAEGRVVVMRTGRDASGKPGHLLINRQILTRRYFTAAAIAVVSMDYAPPGFVDANYRGSLVMPKGAPDTTRVPSYLYISTGMARAMLGVDVDSARTGQAGAAVEGQVLVDMQDAPGRNVIAILRGSDPVLRNEYIAIGAHNDHVGTTDQPVDHDSLYAFMRIAAPQGADNRRPNPTAADWARINAMKDSLRAVRGARLDSIYNGADDDGSGSMSVLEIAERFATAPTRPKRSILFVWHVAEEMGLFGSAYFTDHPTVPRESIVAQLNMDMVGRGGAGDFTGVTKAGEPIHGGPGYVQLVGARRLSTELGDMVERVNLRDRLGLRFDYSIDADGHPQNIYCRSDHYEYARYGIPIVFFTTGGHADYHQVTDEPQYIDYDRMTQISRLVHGTATALANLDHRVVVDKPKPDPRGRCVQ